MTRSSDPILSKTRSGGTAAKNANAKANEKKRKKESKKEKERKEAEKRQKLNDRYAVVKASAPPPNTEQEDSDEDECLETGEGMIAGETLVNKGSGDANQRGKDGRDCVIDETSTLRARLEEMTRVTAELQRKLSEVAVPANVTADLEKMSQAATTITRDSGISLASMVRDDVENNTTVGTRVGRVGYYPSGGVTANAVMHLSEIQQIAMMEDVEKHEELKDQLEKYVNKTVFPSTKFPIGKEKEEKLCRIAAHKGKVKLPVGVDLKVFGRQFSKVVRARMNKLRSNTQGAAKAKFEKDWRTGKVPEDLLENLMENYRDYFDKDGSLIPGREGNYEAFVYFVDRILTSVNSRVNDYGPKVRKAVELSKVFTVTDEAFALITLENYYERWVRMLEAGKNDADEDSEGGGVLLDKTTQRSHDWFSAKYTSSQRGKQAMGWNMEGIARFTEIAEMVKARRLDDRMGSGLEKGLVRYWVGRDNGEGGRRAGEIVDQYVDHDLFGGDVEDI